MKPDTNESARIITQPNGLEVVWCRDCGELDGETSAQVAARKLLNHRLRHRTDPL